MARIEPAPEGYQIIKIDRAWLVLVATYGPQGALTGVNTLKWPDGRILTQRSRKDALTKLQLALLANENAHLRARVSVPQPLAQATLGEYAR